MGSLPLPRTSPAPAMLPHQQGPQPGERSMGHHPNQDNRQSSSKGDGTGSCALPGLTQWEERNCNSQQP